MDIKYRLLGMAGAFFCCAIATAGDMGPVISPQGFLPVLSLQGGYASIHAGKAERFIGTDFDLFTYRNASSGKSTGFIGVFVGAEHALPWISYPGVFMQAGVEYNYFGRIAINGLNTVGIQPQSITSYRYNYHFQTQQVLATLKLFATSYERFHPYGEVGLGAAFNHAGQYQATTINFGSLNLTPGFSNQNKTQFSYSLGLGVDRQVNKKIRVGLGYRYSNFGSSPLKNGRVVFNNYQFPVPFALGHSKAYANQLLARITYLA